MEEKDYKPTDEAVKAIREVYVEFDEMRDVKAEKYRELNDRTPVQFWDDSQLRANGYVPDKASQGKEEWQANVFTPTTRNKIKALLASIAKSPPPISMTAVNERNQNSVIRAEIMKHLVEASYVQGGKNPEVTIFLDGWNCAINGTVIKYDGYLKAKNKVKLLKNYDIVTGEVEVEEKEVYTADEPVEIEVPLQHFFYKNAYISNVQEQPALIWVEYYDEERFQMEFGKYKNAKHVPHGGKEMGATESQTFFYNLWEKRVGKKQYEVLRYYRKNPDTYRIVANGVLLLDAPLLWGRSKKKYPFAKQIFEPFANSNFFLGNSLPNILMAEQDIENAFINSMTDKTFRSLVQPVLIGLPNKDSFDLEDEYVDGDTKIYVEDVNQVKPMPIPQVNQSEIAMLNIIRGGLDEDSTDGVQSGSSGSGSTAREIVIANERAEELKGLFFIFMKDLWVQKYTLRSLNIAMNYSKAKVKAVAGEDGAQEFEKMFQTFNVPSVELSDGTMGGMMIEVVEDQGKMSKPGELDVREEVSRIEGKPVEIVQITSDFLDDYEYIVQIESENLYRKSKALKMAMNDEKIRGVATMFPSIFAQAQQKFFEDYIEGYGDNPEKYMEGINAMAMMPGQQMPGGEVGSQVTAPTKSLPALTGV